MSKATEAAIARGLRRGARIGMTGDTSSLRRLREEISRTDTTQAAWASVGQSIRSGMNGQSRALYRSR